MCVAEVGRPNRIHSVPYGVSGGSGATQQNTQCPLWSLPNRIHSVPYGVSLTPNLMPFATLQNMLRPTFQWAKRALRDNMVLWMAGE